MMCIRGVRSLGVAALAVASIGLVGCSQTMSAGDAQDGRAALRNDARDLEANAARANVGMEFEEARRAYEALALVGSEAGDEGLRLAMALSNAGHFGRADKLFDDLTLQTTGAAPAQTARLLAFRAQHNLNRARFGEGDVRIARVLALSSIELYDDAIEQVGELPLQLAIAASVEGGRLFAVSRDAGAVRIRQSSTDEINRALKPDAVGFFGGPQALSPEQQLALGRTQAEFVVATADVLTGDIAAAQERLARISVALRLGQPLWLSAAAAGLEGRIALASQPADLDRAWAAFDRAATLERELSGASRATGLALLRVAAVDLRRSDRAAAYENFRQGSALIRRSGVGVDLGEIAPILDDLGAQPAGADRDEAIFSTLQMVRSLGAARAAEEVAFRMESSGSDQALALRSYLNGRERRDALARRLGRLSSSSSADAQQRQFLEAELAAAYLDEQNSAAEAKDLIEALNQFRGEQVALAEFQRGLNGTEVVALPLLGVDGGFVALITHDALHLRRTDLSERRAAEMVALLKGLLAQTPKGYILPDIYKFDVSYALYNGLFGEHAGLIENAELLTVVPSGPLASLPFAMLTTAPFSSTAPLESTSSARAYGDYDQAPWLIRSVPISTALSINSMQASRRGSVGASQGARAFVGFADFDRIDASQAGAIVAANPALSPSCASELIGYSNQALPETANEVRDILQMLGGPSKGEVITGARFSDTSIAEMNLSDVRVLHFATHGLLAGVRKAQECIVEPALWTSFDPNGGDAQLQASEVALLNLDADLVVLSACDTGGSAGDSLSGLTRSFFAAGARNVISSHWTLDDAAARALMQGLYAELSGGERIKLAEALRRAMLGLIATKAGAHPYFWAALSIYGDGGSVVNLSSEG